MLKGRLLRQKAINLEGDQKLAKLSEQNKSEEDVKGTHRASDSSIKSTYKETGEQCGDGGHMDKKSLIEGQPQSCSVKKINTIISKRMHSSPLNFKKPHDQKSTLRSKSADNTISTSHKKVVEEQSAYNPREARTLEEVVQEFLLYFHDKRSSDKTSVRISENKTGNILNVSPRIKGDEACSIQQQTKIISHRFSTGKRIPIIEGKSVS